MRTRKKTFFSLAETIFNTLGTDVTYWNLPQASEFLIIPRLALIIYLNHVPCTLTSTKDVCVPRFTILNCFMILDLFNQEDDTGIASQAW
jgi:hypothetical protein